MAAGDRLYYLRAATKNVTAIADATHATFSLTESKHVDDGVAGSPGPVEVLTGAYYTLTGMVFGKNLNTFLALLGSAAENLVLGIEGAAGVNEKITLKNAKFGGGGVLSVNLPRATDGAGVQVYGIPFECAFAITDTPGTMIVPAADA